MNQNEYSPLSHRGNEGTSRNAEVPANVAENLHPAHSEEALANSERHPEPSFGARLRASRERHGMSLQDCANILRLPVRLLQQLEADDYEGIDYSVYLCGYLRKYADHVRLDRTHVEAQLESLETHQPELVVTHTLPAWKYGLQRYSSALTYIVLTAVIVVPLIWLGLNGVLKRDIARLQPLNATPVGAPSDAPASVQASNSALANTASPDASARTGAQAGTQKSTQDQKPLMASIAPFSAMQSPVQPKVTATKPAPGPATNGARLTLALQQPSWVDISDTSGKHLEYALLPAGTHRAYRSDQDLNVRIGNAQGAQVDVDGKPVVLDRFRHANVAHFDVANDGTIRPDNS